MGNQISAYFKYANLQMAAEALYDFDPQANPTPAQITAAPVTSRILTDGNNHASKFADTLAAEFVQQWEVVEHISNTSTGFSGTLFRARKDDPAAGIVAGELVLSFRSTEFVDDQVRDNQATNKKEIKVTGYSLGRHLALGEKRCTA